MQKLVFVTYRFSHFHCWPEAPEEYAYLRNLHRHEFHVRMEVPVTDSNRQIEFIQLKERLASVCGYAAPSYLYAISEHIQPVLQCEGAELLPQSIAGRKPIEWSCEHWCEYILYCFPNASFVEVSEDGENGACMMRTMEEISIALSEAEDFLQKQEQQQQAQEQQQQQPQIDDDVKWAQNAKKGLYGTSYAE